MTTQTGPSLKALIERYHIKATVEYGAPDNPEFKDATPWTVTLRMGRKRASFPFYTGSAITREPTAADVLECIISDATEYEAARDFEDWASDLGYDTDSRRAERIYKNVERETAKLRRFLGDLFNEFADYDRNT